MLKGAGAPVPPMPLSYETALAGIREAAPRMQWLLVSFWVSRIPFNVAKQPFFDTKSKDMKQQTTWSAAGSSNTGSRVELLQDVQAGLCSRAFRDLCQVIIGHEEGFHAGVHVEPHMLPEGVCQGQQQSSLWFAASNSQTTEFTPCQLELTPGGCLPLQNALSALLWQGNP